MLTKPKAIIFDWDNTLVDSWSILLDAMNDTLHKFNMTKLTLAEMKERTFHSMREIFPTIFGNSWEKAGKLYLEQYVFYRNKNLMLFDDALGFLELIHNENDIYTAIVSNKSGDVLRDEVKLLSLEKYFDKIVGAGDAEKDKPSVLPIKLALEKSNLSLSQDIWYIGDTIGDMECAFNAGCKQVFFGCDINESVLTKYKSVLTFENYQKLINYFKKNFF